MKTTNTKERSSPIAVDILPVIVPPTAPAVSVYLAASAKMRLITFLRALSMRHYKPDRCGIAVIAYQLFSLRSLIQKMLPSTMVPALPVALARKLSAAVVLVSTKSW